MPAVLCILFLLVLLCFPELCVRGAADGLALWLFTLVPTFFPFVFLSNLMVSCGAADDISRFCGRILRPLFHVSASGAYILLMGFLCGYPMGAKLTAEFVNTGRISGDEGCRLLTFCNNPSPMFLVGFVLSDCMQKPYSRAGTLAMFYAAPILTGILFAGIAARKDSLFKGIAARKKTFTAKISARKSSLFSEAARRKKSFAAEIAAQKVSTKETLTLTSNAHPAAESLQPAGEPTVMEQIRASMRDAFATLLYLGGYVILFHIGSALILSLAGHFSSDTYPFFCLLTASLEMSGGAAYLAASGLSAGFVNLFVPLCVIFGGFCIMAQTAGLLSGSGLTIRPCIIGKLIQTGIAAGIYLLIYLLQ
ncbi:MAG: hypothetical protein LUE29_11990 [Lachnospiraceae bacterium]|nr:hypothetical protein [Lachnospiraceae bacterium]